MVSAVSAHNNLDSVTEVFTLSLTVKRLVNIHIIIIIVVVVVKVVRNCETV